MRKTDELFCKTFISLNAEDILNTTDRKSLFFFSRRDCLIEFQISCVDGTTGLLSTRGGQKVLSLTHLNER